MCLNLKLLGKGHLRGRKNGSKPTRTKVILYHKLKNEKCKVKKELARGFYCKFAALFPAHQVIVFFNLTKAGIVLQNPFPCAVLEIVCDINKSQKS